MTAIAILLQPALSIFIAVKLARCVGKRRDTRQAQRDFILNYDFPRALQRKLGEVFPELEPGRIPIILNSLRQWFLLIQAHPGLSFDMPSRAVDMAWHEFILLTCDYHAFCERAFGEYLHHVPFQGGLAREQERDALARTFALAPLAAAISGGVLAEGLKDPSSDLFELDRMLVIPGGRLYETSDHEDFRQRWTAASDAALLVMTDPAMAAAEVAVAVVVGVVTAAEYEVKASAP